MPEPKPPLGLMPEHLWLEVKNQERIDAIEAAIARYKRAGYSVPVLWIEEWEKRTKEQEKSNG